MFATPHLLSGVILRLIDSARSHAMVADIFYAIEPTGWTHFSNPAFCQMRDAVQISKSPLPRSATKISSEVFKVPIQLMMIHVPLGRSPG